MTEPLLADIKRHLTQIILHTVFLQTPFQQEHGTDVNKSHAKLENHVDAPKKSAKHLLGYQEDAIIFALNFHAQNHVTESRKRFEDLNFLTHHYSSISCIK